MSYSSLATKYLPAYVGNYTKGREGKKISEITIHHMAMVATVEDCAKVFQRVGREGSSHYGIGLDGQIACYVDEENTAWTNSNWASNCRAVTIETSNIQRDGDWPVSDASLNSLIKLVADIAIRNNLGLLTVGKNLTYHRMYAATACPGPYLISKIDYICAQANNIISGGTPSSVIPVNCYYAVKTTNKLYGEVVNQSDYAGSFGEPITLLAAHTDVGQLSYAVHLLKENRWLPFVTGYSWADPKNGYAGIEDRTIDAVAIKSDVTTVHYKVRTLNGKFLPEVTGCDINDSKNGYGGIFGQEIDAIYIWADGIIKVEDNKPAEEPTHRETVKEEAPVEIEINSTIVEEVAVENTEIKETVEENKTEEDKQTVEPVETVEEDKVEEIDTTTTPTVEETINESAPSDKKEEDVYNNITENPNKPEVKENKSLLVLIIELIKKIIKAFKK